MHKIFVWAATILGIFFILIAVYYWITPAGALPTFFPGYEPGVAAVHFKHGLASLILGAACLIFAWFMSGSKKVSG